MLLGVFVPISKHSFDGIMFLVVGCIVVSIKTPPASQNGKIEPWGEQQGAKSYPKTTERQPRGAQRQPRGAKRGRKVNQRATKMHPKIDLL